MYVQEIVETSAATTDIISYHSNTRSWNLKTGSKYYMSLADHWKLNQCLLVWDMKYQWHPDCFCFKAESFWGYKGRLRFSSWFWPEKMHINVHYTHMHSSFASNTFSLFSSLYLLITSFESQGISVSIIVFSCKSLMKLKITLFLQWGFTC